LWRAVLDYKSGRRYAFSRSAHTTAAFAEADPEPADSVLVPTISAGDMQAWMEQFAAQQHAATETKLRAALGEDDASRAFEKQTRLISGLERRWRRTVRTHVTARLRSWAGTNSIPLDDLVADPSDEVAADLPGDLDPEGALRQRILRALSAMPLNELLRIPVPIEYILRQ